MGHRPFRTPIFLRLNSYANFRADSPWDALDYLEIHWRQPETEAYLRAKSACHSAVDGWIDAEIAYAAVVLASREAGLLQPGFRPATTDTAGFTQACDVVNAA